MKYVSHYECTLCHRTYPKTSSLYTCEDCGEQGILDIIYDYNHLKQDIDFSYFTDNTDSSMWRYLPFMSVKNAPENTLHIGGTPLYKAVNMGQDLGLENVYIKDEGLNPTASLKDRASGVAVVKAIEEGQTIISCSSTGNAASSLAGNAAKMGLKSVIFVPERAPIGKLTQLLVYGATVFSVQGDYKDAFQLSKQAIDHYGWYNRNAAINPHMVEGKKTVAFEIAEQLQFKPTDWVIVSVGDGCTIGAIYNGFNDFKQVGLIDTIPKILGVQSDGCSPFYDAFIHNQPLQETEEHTIADSIAVGIPRNPVKAMRAVKQSGGTWITVSDKAILESIQYLGKLEGIFGEPAGVAAVAGLQKALQQGIIKQDESITVIMTGNGLKDTKNGQKSTEKPISIKPDLTILKSILDKEN